MGNKRVFFDVVNSVKGGSGKSTFSLLLAAYCNSDQYKTGEDPEKSRHAQAYIIDLDFCGTSWEMNYGLYIRTDYWRDNAALQTRSSKAHSEYPFINNLLWDYKKYCSKSFWSHISFANKKTDDFDRDQSTLPKILLCPARTDQRSTVDQIEVDMFEHTIERIILDILKTHHSDSEVDDVHIILDMPPSYEKHAEAILKHLLTSQNSKLFQASMDKTGLFYKDENEKTQNYYEPYVINLFMLNSISRAHIEQNSVYLYNWFQNMEYSSVVTYLMQNKRFKIRYILNDICDIMRKGDRSLQQICMDLENPDEDGFSAHLKKTRDFVVKKGESVFSIKGVEHLAFSAETEIFLGKKSEQQLKIPDEALQAIKSATEELILTDEETKNGDER